MGIYIISDCEAIYRICLNKYIAFANGVHIDKKV